MSKGKSTAPVVRYVIVAALLAITWLIGGAGAGAHASPLRSAVASEGAGLSTVSTGVTVRIYPHMTTSLCGTVSAYTEATLTAAGSITIGGQQLAIAPGVALYGPAVLVGTDLCLAAQFNASGQITGGTVTVNAPTNINACGTVTSYTPATAFAAGSVTIAGQTFAIAAGTTLSGATITAGSPFCLSVTTNTSGQITGGTVTVGTSTSLDVCGTVTAYVPATATAAGSITIAGQAFSLAPGTTFTGATITVGSPFCLNATTNTSGQITGGAVTATTMVTVCGTVTAYTAATSSTSGSITIDGQTFAIAPGTTFAGATITVGATMGLTVTVTATTPPTIVSATVTSGCTVLPTATAAAPTATVPAPPPPPSLPTATATATVVPPAATATMAPPATATAMPTATTAPTPLGVLPQLVSRAVLHHRGKTAFVQWHMAYQLGIKGFRIYAQKHDLSARLIRPHRSPNYTARVKWVAHAHYTLRMFFKNGHSRKVAIH